MVVNEGRVLDDGFPCFVDGGAMLLWILQVGV